MTQPEIRDCLDASSREGVAAQISGNVVEYYLVPLAVFMGAGSGKIGWLVAAPALLAAAAQLFVAEVARAVANRKRLLVVGAVLQGLLLLPVAMLPLLPRAGWYWALLTAIAAYKVVGGVMTPVWGSLMSEYLAPDERGRYFGGRNRLLHLSGMVLLVVFGAGLALLKNSAAGLAAVFAVGAAARLASVRWMSRMIDLPDHARDEAPSADPRALWRKLRESEFARFSVRAAVMVFAVQTASSFLHVHTLRDLKFGYAEYSAVRLAALLGGFAAFPLWGLRADRSGNAGVVRLTAMLIPLVPLPWIFFDGVVPLCLAELFGGAVWAGFSLCSGNYIFDAVRPERRMRALGYFSVLQGAATFSGAGLGGALAQSLPPLLGSSMHSVFALSIVLRLGAATLFCALGAAHGQNQEALDMPLDRRAPEPPSRTYSG